MSTISVNEIYELFEIIWSKLSIEKKIDLHNYFCYVHDFDEDEIVVDDNNTNVIDSEGDNSPFYGVCTYSEYYFNYPSYLDGITEFDEFVTLAEENSEIF